MKKFSDLPEFDKASIIFLIHHARKILSQIDYIIQHTPDTAELVDWVQGIRGQLSVWLEEKE